MSVILTAQPGRGEKIHLLVNGQYIATTDKTRWYSLGLPDKSEIDEEQLSEILDMAAEGRMYEKALDLLTQREYSRKELADKLVQKAARKKRPNRDIRDFGVTDASFSDIILDAQKTDYAKLRQRANEVCDKLEEQGLLSDERFARMFAEEKLRTKHLSACGLKTALQQKGVSRELADSVVEDLNPDPDETIRELLQTKYRSRDLSDERDRRRTIQALQRLGYTYSEITRVIQEDR